MDRPNGSIQQDHLVHHDETVANLLIFSLILFTVFTSVILIGFF
jgi:hypothetical protein